MTLPLRQRLSIRDVSLAKRRRLAHARVQVARRWPREDAALTRHPGTECQPSEPGVLS